MVLSPSLATSTAGLPATSTTTASASSLVHSPLGHWWAHLFQQQAKLENILENRFTVGLLNKTQEAAIHNALKQQLTTLRTQLLTAFQASKPSATTPHWFEHPTQATVLNLLTQRQHWAEKLTHLLPQPKPSIARYEQQAFIEAVIPSVLLASNTIRVCNQSNRAPLAETLPLDGITLLEERISPLNATTVTQWGELLQASLANIAHQYENTFSGLPSLPPQAFPALLGVLLLGSGYYYYWVTHAFTQPNQALSADFWETEACLFEALQFFNTGSVTAVLWHQHLEKLKPTSIIVKPYDVSVWLQALETAMPTKCHATEKQLKRADQLQAKLKAGTFMSAICEENTQQLWEALTQNQQPLDIYSCLQKMTETPCDVKDMVTAVWQYQLQTSVPHWLAWAENPTQDQWEMLTHQLLKHETSVLKSIETALLHKTVLGEAV